MAIIKDDSRSTSLNLSVLDDKGARRYAVIVGCHIRPGAGMAINVDVQDKTAINEENREELSQAVSAFIRQELIKAAEAGIPVSAL